MKVSVVYCLKFKDLNLLSSKAGYPIGGLIPLGAQAAIV